MTARKKKHKKIYPAPAPDKKKTGNISYPRYCLAASVSLITFLVYLGSLQNDFVNWDDGPYVYENPNIRSFNAAFFKWAFSGFHASNWHPLTWISHALDYALWGLNPLGHHLTNNLFHAANAFLVVVMVLRLLEIYKEMTAANEATAFPDERRILIAGGVAGLLFGLHPVHVESVAWIAERKDLLCAMFFMLSILMYVEYATTAEKPAPQASSPLLFNKSYLLALIFFILALLGKPMAVSLPFVLLILDWSLFKRIRSLKSFSLVFAEKLLFVALSIISSILTVLAQKAGGAVVATENVMLSTRLLVAAKSLMAYLRNIILPLNLSQYYPYPEDVSALSLEYGLPVLLVTGITIFSFFMARRQKIWMAVWGYYLVTLLPVLGIVQVGNQAMADRYTYLPGLGPFFLIGLSGAWLSKKIGGLKKGKLLNVLLGASAAIFIFIPMAYLTFGQIQLWRDSITLWNSVIDKYPNVAIAYNNRGLAKQRLNDPGGALSDYDKAIELTPSYEKAYNNRGILRQKLGDYEGAIKDYDKAVELKPSFTEAYSNRGIAKAIINNYAGAIKDFDVAVAASPGHPDILFNRGLAKFMSKDISGACGDWEKASQLGSFQAAEKIGKNCK